MDLNLDHNHDLHIIDGELVTLDDIREECRQQVLIALKMGLGEYNMDTSKGTPYLQMAGIGIDKAAVSARIRAVLSGVPYVKEVTTVDVGVDTSRQVHIKATGKPFGAVEVLT